MPQPVRKIVFPVAGLGTRFLPATKAVPKEMLPVVDKPLIQYAVEDALEAGIDQFIFVTGRGKQSIEDHFDHAYELEKTLADNGKTALLDQLAPTLPPAGNVAFTRQQRPLGLGHAIWCARHFIGDEPFAISLPDMLVDASPSCLTQMVKVYEQTGGNVIGVEECAPEDTDKYGVITPGDQTGTMIEVKGLVEKPAPADAPSRLFLSGRYILNAKVFDYLDSQEPGAGGEIQLTDSMAKLIGEQPFHALKYDGKVHDCGDKVGFLKANVALALKRDDMAGRVREALAELGLKG